MKEPIGKGVLADESLFQSELDDETLWVDGPSQALDPEGPTSDKAIEALPENHDSHGSVPLDRASHPSDTRPTSFPPLDTKGVPSTDDSAPLPIDIHGGASFGEVMSQDTQNVQDVHQQIALT